MQYSALVAMAMCSTIFGTCECLVADGVDSLQVQLDEERQARQQLEVHVNQLQSTMNTIVESLETECSLTCPARKTVAFMAQISRDLVNPAKGRVVVFDQVHTNEGNGYNDMHGIFTAPVNGTYNFNVVATSPPNTGNHWLHLFIMQNNVEMGYVFLDTNDKYYLRRTTDVTLHLVTGDEIWVQVADVIGDHVLTGCCFHSHFSGFLINAD